MAMRDAERLGQLSDAVRESSLKRLRKVPPGQENWRPDPGSMSFADLAQHLLDCDAHLTRSLGEGPQPPEHGGVGIAQPRDREEYIALVDALDLSGAERRELIESIDDFDRTVFDERFGETTVWWVLARGNLDHEIHHRGQIAAYLRQCGSTAAL
ncbi:MAG: DinB family protein [Planctomycetota bacterium]|jgi:uncharacterized damage-inducible protein DinB